MIILSPTSNFQVRKHSKEEGHIDFLETLGGSHGSAEEEG
jgi:hypothetical protein